MSLPFRISSLFAVVSTAAPVLATSFTFSSPGGLQTYTAPVTGLYQITADGASGGATDFGTGGFGASITASFSLTAGQILDIYVGEEGGFGGGGGGTFVTLNGNALLVAGGGGGGAEDPNGTPSTNDGQNAQLVTSGGTPAFGGSGGTNGSGGQGVPNCCSLPPGSGTGGGGGGGGFTGSGTDGDETGSGGQGFNGSPMLAGGSGGGGYGGGAAGGGDTFAGGGGGGYSGGGGAGVDMNGVPYGGGGGGSYWASTLGLSDTILSTTGDGSVNVVAPALTSVPEPGSAALLLLGLIAAALVCTRRSSGCARN